MSELNSFWRDLSGARRVGLLLGMALIVLLVAALAWWSFRAPYGVLFSDLSDQDAATVARELDKLKVPYEVAANGHSILVVENSVHKVRMALMGRQLPLHGGVGFELFNNAEFGASDFVQKVNYQRALQGELTRTIGSIEEVQSARVHLALPEQGLFRKDSSRSKASVTVAMKQGHTLTPGQVQGIQRLVGASVPEVKAEDVTVLNQHGIPLSRSAGDDGSSNSLVAGGQLDSKKELELHLSEKASRVLEKLFGKDGALVTVDVALSNVQSKVTTEEVLAAANLPKEQIPTGVLVRERSVTRDIGGEGDKSAGPVTTTQESDYLTGRRTEQVVSAPGGVARIHVAAVVRAVEDEQQLVHARELLQAAVGAQLARGDMVTVYSMTGAGIAKSPASAIDTGRKEGNEEPLLPIRHSATSEASNVVRVLVVLLGVVLLLVGLSLWLKSRSRPSALSRNESLSADQREAVLRSVRGWLDGDGGVA
ncbi:flagellar M-ring protein FliF [Paucibacter sp. KBW04]|uniref:flagellar basal-body MS-ring/collar protein FliF n=1 Tax=Paucibacter sp. KBW04 TaxID=2153361 RepID=UPI000F563BED|nr:flagellar basal-body MS-ring/collar protein FliF [Paucibacter sp. KBW04]RQO63593.1 flagellar M-ring protein FliF [Paucibacter sp. KBW04]